VPGALVIIHRDDRPTRVRVARMANGRVRLEIRGRDVVAAAWEVAAAGFRAVDGSRATRFDKVVRLVDPPPGGRFALPPAVITGTGERRWKGVFRVGPGAQLGDHGAVYLNLGYDTPSGGRARVLVNGRLLGTVRFGTHGRGRQRLRFALVNDYGGARNGDLRPGANTVELVAWLPPRGCHAAGAAAPRIDVLPGSRVKFDATARRDRAATLALWPFPFTEGDSWDDSAIVLPAVPKPSELSAVVEVLAAAQRWSVTPALPDITFGGAPPAAGHVLVLARARSAAVAAGIDDAPPWRVGLLAALRADGDTDVVAYGTRALRPLRAEFAPGRVSGSAVLVDERGRVRTIAGDGEVSAYRPLPAPWKGPAAILVAIAIGGFGVAWARARRQVALMPTPERSPGGDW
jgi:cellulose synthase subunit